MTVNITLSKTTAAPGEEVIVNWTVKNNLTSTYYFQVEFYINDSPFYGPLKLGTLSPGVSKNSSFSFQAPQVAGVYTIEAVSYISFDNASWLNEDSDSKNLTVEAKEPKFELIKNTAYTYFTINGKNVGPGEYSVKKGSYIQFKITIKNSGTGADYCWIGIYDSLSKQYVWYTGDYLSAGQTKSYSESIRVDRNMNLKVEVGQGELVGQNRHDYWGC